MKKIFFISALALTILATGGCKKEKEEPTSIIGTWKCIGFGATESDVIKGFEPKGLEYYYTITFKEDKTFKGRSAFYFMKGTYKIIGRNFTFDKYFVYTSNDIKIGEAGDAESYSKALPKIHSYEVQNNKLKLYYSEKQYLLFNPKN